MSTTRRRASATTTTATRKRAAARHKMGAAPAKRRRPTQTKTKPMDVVLGVLSVGAGILGGYGLSALAQKQLPAHNAHLRNAGLAILAGLVAFNSKRGGTVQLVAMGAAGGAVANSGGQLLADAGLSMTGSGQHTNARKALTADQRKQFQQMLKDARQMAMRDPHTLNGDPEVLNGYA